MGLCALSPAFARVETPIYKLLDLNFKFVHVFLFFLHYNCIV